VLFIQAETRAKISVFKQVYVYMNMTIPGVGSLNNSLPEIPDLIEELEVSITYDLNGKADNTEVEFYKSAAATDVENNAISIEFEHDKLTWLKLKVNVDFSIEIQVARGMLKEADNGDHVLKVKLADENAPLMTYNV